jgi:glycogen debranching enzyme
LVRRILSLRQDRLYEIIALHNFSLQPISLQLELWSGARFEDIFEVRGFKREKRGTSLAPEDLTTTTPTGRHHQQIRFHYLGLDGLLRQTQVTRYFHTEKIRLSPTVCGQFMKINLGPQDEIDLRSRVDFVTSPDEDGTFAEMSVPEAIQFLGAPSDRESLFQLTRIETDHAIVNRAIERSRVDLQMLLTEDKFGQQPSSVSPSRIPFAGIPWFSAPFGRDSIITAYQLLPWHPGVAKEVLDFVFAHLGNKEDPFTDEQPGKVFHELRVGEMANTREVPFIPYFGTVDATPLCLILLHEYIKWTHDRESLERWWPNAMRCLVWLERFGDADGDGFIEYHKLSPNGLVHQGWKDSHDSIMHEDGSPAKSPIRLCEVQAYAYRAFMSCAELAQFRGESAMAASLRTWAVHLRARFSDLFWDPQGEFVALALDENKKPCRVQSSNMGHCLWGGILNHEQARAVARSLLGPDLFMGYGIRTLSRKEVAYNPMSYHNGSVWPHDNSLILEGLRHYGLHEETQTLTDALLDVLESVQDYRLPELFCGFKRRGFEPPVPYPVACKPQAWAAGSLFLLIKSMLGLSIDLDQDHLIIRSPILGGRIRELQVTDLAIRGKKVNLVFRKSADRVQVESLNRNPELRILIVKS